MHSNNKETEFFITVCSCCNNNCGWFGLSHEAIPHDIGDGEIDYSCPICNYAVSVRHPLSNINKWKILNN